MSYINKVYLNRLCDKKTVAKPKPNTIVIFTFWWTLTVQSLAFTVSISVCRHVYNDNKAKMMNNY